MSPGRNVQSGLKKEKRGKKIRRGRKVDHRRRKKPVAKKNTKRKFSWKETGKVLGQEVKGGMVGNRRGSGRVFKTEQCRANIQSEKRGYILIVYRMQVSAGAVKPDGVAEECGAKSIHLETKSWESSIYGRKDPRVVVRGQLGRQAAKKNFPVRLDVHWGKF